MEIEKLVEYANANSCAYINLETLCICYPGRVSGSSILESALDFLCELATKEGFDVREEYVNNVPNWVRGDSDAEKLIVDIDATDCWPIPNPLQRVFRIMANGMSPGTSTSGISGKIITVESIAALNALDPEVVKGNIVLLDYQTYTTYGDLSSDVRGSGAIYASKLGASAYLNRSITPDNSTSGLHTGTIWDFPEGIKPIPTAACTIEDAELLTRLIKRGYKLNGNITLPCKRYEDKTSRNIIFEIPGCGSNGNADEIVLIGGHTDSWECHHLSCQGAHDDGQGVMVCLEALKMIKDSGIIPSRTIRCVLFVDEECRQSGAKAYLEQCKDVEKIVCAMETDLGAGPVIGFGFTGGEGGAKIVNEILKPMEYINKFKSNIKDSKTGKNICNDNDCVNRVDEKWSGYGVDTYPLVVEAGVPGILLRHEDTWWYEDYFHHHHTASDTINNINPDLLMLNLHAVMSAAFLIANTDKIIP
jgi:hypothetical protein